MANGVAEAASSVADLANFLGGEPEGVHEDEESQDEDGESQDETEDEDSESEDTSEEDTDEETSEPQANRKVKVPVKDENGQESFEEIEESELVAGYHRQKDYTKKTMELADRERQAAEIVQKRVTEASEYSMQQAKTAKAVVASLAGLKSADEMYSLSVSDPGAWVQEQQRSEAIYAAYAKLDEQEKADKARLEQVDNEVKQAKLREAWSVLEPKGISPAILGEIYGKASKAYGIKADELSKVYDPGIALALQDAIKYRELQDKKPQITKKVAEAERLPTNKKSLPPNERVNRTLGEKFSKGRAKVNDLAAFLVNNKM